MNNKTFQQKYEISLLFINAQKKLGLYQLLNILQDIALRQGAKVDYTQEPNIYWIITRQALKVSHWPSLGKEIVVKTWITADKRGFLLREYTVFLEGKNICTCSTSIAKLNAKTKRIVGVTEEDIEKYTTKKELSYSPSRIRPFKDFEVRRSFSVRNSDIDYNQHVNNTVYCKWVLDSIPYEKHLSCNVSSYEVNFLAETFLDDEIEIQKSPQDLIFQGTRASDKKIVFTSRIEAEPK